MNKKWILLISIIIFAALLLGACAEDVAPPAPDVPDVDLPDVDVPDVDVPDAPDADEPVVLRVGAMYPQDCWNPFACTGVWYFSQYIIEGFTDHGPTSTGCEGVPRLAESWEYSEDGRTVTITLHEGITFSDGTPFNAETAVWNIETFYQDPGLVEWFAETLSLESTEIIDERTFSYTTFDPIINSPDYDWQWWYMLPPSQWEDIDPSEYYTFESFPPIGTGPYVVTEHVPGSYIIYDAREDYYRGKPPIDRFVYTLYSNADAIVQALIGGELDITTPWLPPEVYDTLADAENITVEEKEPYSGSIYWLIFNMASGGTKNPAIDDPIVREAIDYAIDKQQLVDVALLGHGVVLPIGWVGKTDIELNPELEVTPFDLTKAAQLLDDAGYLDTDGDGVRETPDGVPLEFNVVHGVEFPPVITMTNMLSDWLGSIGITLLPEAHDVGSWNALVLSEQDFDMAINAATHDIDAASMDFWFSCWSSESGSNALNYPSYCNPEMDDLVYAYWFSDDPDGRWEYMYEAQQIMADDRPFITLAGQNSIQAYRSDRYEFPLDTCDVGFNMFDPEGLLNATVK